MTDDGAKRTLHGYLREARETMVWKLDGLSEYDVRRPLTPTCTNLLGLVKHLSIVEAWYFGKTFNRPFAEDLPWWDEGADEQIDMWVTEAETRAEIVDRYRRVWLHADATINDLPADAPGHVPWWPQPDVTLHTMLVHVLAETNRHAGHADILREQLDGAAGMRSDNSNVRELRELVRHRAKLVGVRTGQKASLHAVLGKCGVIPTLGDIFGPRGQKLLDSLAWPQPYASRVDSQRRLLLMLDNEIDLVEHQLHHRLKDDASYQALLRIKGIGPTFAAIFLAEIGDVHRFGSPHQPACWAGLTPRHYESDRKARRGNISKQGSRLLRWAAIEACQRSCEPYVAAHRQRIRDGRGKTATQISKVAAARKLLHVVYYTLRDGQARCLQTASAG